MSDTNDATSSKLRNYFKNLLNFSQYDAKTILYIIIFVVLVILSLVLLYYIYYTQNTNVDMDDSVNIYII